MQYIVQPNRAAGAFTQRTIAAAAADHRERAEASLELAVLRNKPQYIELAMREYQLARDVEGGF